MNRRGFFARVGAVVAGAAMAPFIAKSSRPDFAKATFTFWRNKADYEPNPSAFDNLRATMRDVYDQCERGGGNLQ